ncbi:MAG TPA: hypothetical protein VMW85_00540 [Methanomassiliicoccales archaeon]|nr:hypothetical protein [Methanomassiliicoccales archaeon]
MGKKRLLVILGCLITIIIVLSAAIFIAGMSPEKTLAERMALASSDINEIGGHVGEGSAGAPKYFSNSTSDYWYLISGNEFSGYVHIYAFNSMSLCQSEYSNGIHHDLADNCTTIIGLGNGTDRGYIAWNATSKKYSIDFSVDSVIVTMHFEYYPLLPLDKELSDGKVVFIIIVQYYNIVTILND